MNPDVARQDVADAMRRRREELGITVVEAVARTGVSRSTWKDLESARRAGLSAPIAAKLDRFFDREPGTTARLFRQELSPAALERIDEVTTHRGQMLIDELVSNPATDSLEAELMLLVLGMLSPKGKRQVLEVVRQDLMTVPPHELD